MGTGELAVNMIKAPMETNLEKETQEEGYNAERVASCDTTERKQHSGSGVLGGLPVQITFK